MHVQEARESLGTYMANKATRSGSKVLCNSSIRCVIELTRIAAVRKRVYDGKRWGYSRSCKVVDRVIKTKKWSKIRYRMGCIKTAAAKKNDRTGLEVQE